MEELNKKLESIEKEYFTFQNIQQKQQKTDTFDYKKMINQNIIETEKKSNKLNSFLTDTEIYKQSNEFYDFDKKEDVFTKKQDIFTVDNEVKVNEEEKSNKMNDLLFTNYKTEINNDIMNQQTGHINGLMELPYLNKDGFIKDQRGKTKD